MTGSADVQHYYRQMALLQMKGEDLLDYDELGLFEWYTRESAKTFERMRSEVYSYIEEQKSAGCNFGETDDSGLLVINYYISRARYGDVVFLTSLLEHYLSRASQKLELVIGTGNVTFRPNELQGNKWERHKKFLERHGVSEFPLEVWNTLKDLISVRNAIVHERGEQEIEEGYIGNSLGAFRALVDHVTRQIDQKIDRRLRPEGLEVSKNGK